MTISRKIAFCIWFLLIQFISTAQYKVSFIMNKLPSYHKAGDKIYLAGSFNNWSPGDERYLLKTLNDKPGIIINLPKGIYEYKFTRGGWDKVEALDGGFPSENRKMEVE